MHPDEICGNCKFWEKNTSLCKCRAPEPAVVPQGMIEQHGVQRMIVLWATVDKNCPSCGEWKTRILVG